MIDGRSIVIGVALGLGVTLAVQAAIAESSLNMILTVKPPIEPSFQISAGKVLVTIKPDGEIIYGDDYTPDVAAQAFWAAIGAQHPCRK